MLIRVGVGSHGVASTRSEPGVRTVGGHIMLMIIPVLVVWILLILLLLVSMRMPLGMVTLMQLPLALPLRGWVHHKAHLVTRAHLSRPRARHLRREGKWNRARDWDWDWHLMHRHRHSLLLLTMLQRMRNRHNRCSRCTCTS